MTMASHDLLIGAAETMLGMFGQVASFTGASGSWQACVAFRIPTAFAEVGQRIEARGEEPMAYGLHSALVGVERGDRIDTDGRTFEVLEVHHDSWRVLDALVLAQVQA